MARANIGSTRENNYFPMNYLFYLCIEHSEATSNVHFQGKHVACFANEEHGLFETLGHSEGSIALRTDQYFLQQHRFAAFEHQIKRN